MGRSAALPDIKSRPSSALDSRRCLIEEFFKYLKTGCAYEKRRLESLDTLLIALALLAPIAWQLLVFRHLTREVPTAPTTVALTPTRAPARHVRRPDPPREAVDSRRAAGARPARRSPPPKRRGRLACPRPRHAGVATHGNRSGGCGGRLPVINHQAERGRPAGRGALAVTALLGEHPAGLLGDRTLYDSSPRLAPAAPRGS